MESAPLDWLHFSVVTILGIVSYFLKRSLNAIDSLSEKMEIVKEKVAIIEDREDRRRTREQEYPRNRRRS